jgi:DNA (cytosine-5)-methyltransferase 1
MNMKLSGVGTSGMPRTVIDLFCGAGGLSEGFQQAGFEVRVGQDIDSVAGLTFADAHPKATFIAGPVQDVSVQQLLQASGLPRGELDVLVGGPPCQGYSVYNHQRGIHDPRAGLFREYLRIVEGLQPKWLVMENVSGITSIAGGRVVREIEDGMRLLGYRVEMRLLRAEEFGVPQERRRMFFVATRTSKRIYFPEPTHGFAPGQCPIVTVWDAISDLPHLVNGEQKDEHSYRTEPVNSYQACLRDGASKVVNHSAPKLAAVNVERMSHIPPGGSWRDIPVHLLPKGMKRAKRSDHTKRYGRPRKSQLSCTILTKCDLHWGAYIHPDQERSFSVREAARLQGFPDRFHFRGSRTEQFVQVGNAVPPPLGKAVADAVLSADGERVGISERQAPDCAFGVPQLEMLL